MKRSLPIRDQSSNPNLDGTTASPHLGLPTIMSPALATEYGQDYVYLAVVAIDIDRIRLALEVEPTDILPFGWEVRLTELYLEHSLSIDTPRHRDLIEALCAVLFEQAAEGEALGAQLLFSVYSLIHRGIFPDSMRASFDSWKHAPTELLDTLADLRADRDLPALLLEGMLEVDVEPHLNPLAVTLLTETIHRSIEESKRHDASNPL